MRNFRIMSLAIGLAALVFINAGVVHATTIALHTGANDPTTEGWVHYVGPDTFVGPVYNDVPGIDAWYVDDNGVDVGDTNLYSFGLTPAQITQASAYGWSLSANLRIVDFPDPAPGQPDIGADASPFIAYRDGSRSVQIHFGAQADGDPTVFVPSAFIPDPIGISYALENGGSGYHLYELLFDPNNGLSLSIDNIVVLTNLIDGPVTGQATILFGVGSSCCTGQGNFNLVQFDIVSAVPLPAALPLFGTGLAVMGFLGWRRKRVSTKPV